MNAGKFMYVFFYLDMGYLRKLVQRSAATAPDLGRGESPFVRSSCAMQPLLLCQLCVLRITFMVLFLSVKIDNHTFHIFSLLKVYSLCPSIKKMYIWC